jgi:xanthine dehydrogenase large subunit
MNAPKLEPPLARAAGGVGESVRHEAAHLHVAGEATYIDDILEARGTVHAAFGLSQQAHARIRSMDLSAVRASPGVVDVITADDIPGDNNFGPVLADDPILAPGLVQCIGQPIFMVVADTVDQARRAARRAVLEYDPLPALITVEDALAARSYVIPSVTLERGDWHGAMAGAPHRRRGRISIGGQEQFYLEGQIAYAVPKEDGDMLVYSSTQHPGEAQHKVAHALGVESHRVTIECRRMGGGFGGKESQPSMFACAAAVMARRLNRPVKVRLDRDDDFLITGKRHDFLAEYEVGFDDTGRVLGLDLMLASRCGYSADLSGPVNDRAVSHADNCYHLAAVRIVSHRCKTHTQSATAFRGFGGPQGMMASEHILDEIARTLRLDPLDVRHANFYVPGERDVTHYDMKVEDFIADKLVAQLEAESDYRARRRAIRAWNATSPVIKRGIALTPVKFGISFTATFFNQGAALVHVYTDGSVLLNHGGTEMGQGLFTKVGQVVAEELGIDLAKVRVSASDTSKVPNASATAASSGSDLNGKAAQNAAREIKSRLVAFAAEKYGVAPETIVFAGNAVQIGDERMPFSELVRHAYFGRVQLWASGFYKTPKIGYDPKTLKGRPFYYFAYGAAVSEVAIDTLTGESKLLRADILHDAGRSLNPALDVGQIEGGFVQGMGWLTTEELCWNAQGRLTTHAPSTYKIPVASDVPADFRVKLWDGDNVEDSIHRSKAVGEPPLMLAMSVFHAIKDAIAPAEEGVLPDLDAPATPPEILRVVESLGA